MRSKAFIKTLFVLFLLIVSGVFFVQEKSDAKRYKKSAKASTSQKSAQEASKALEIPAVQSLTRVKALTRQEFQQVTWMEEALFTATYMQEPIGQRLARLEESVYGEVLFSLSPAERIKTLHFTLLERQRVNNPGERANSLNSVANTKTKSKSKLKQAKLPSKLESDDSFKARSSAQNASSQKTKKTEQKDLLRKPKLDGESDYPMVSALENKVFGRIDAESGLDERLERLERQVFGRPQRGPYSARVDNLKLVVLGDTGGSRVASYPASNTNASPNVRNATYFPGIPPRQGHFPYQGQNTRTGRPSPVFTTHGQAPSLPQASPFEGSLAQTEEAVLRQAFPADSVPNRLNRLEQAVFGRVAPPGISEQDRLDRLRAVASAEGQATSDRDAQVLTSPGTLPNGGTPKGSVKSLWPLIPIIILMLL